LSCIAGDVNCLKVPEGLSDHDVLFLTDILPTAWHATEMGEVHDGDVVAIWGAGPGVCAFLFVIYFILLHYLLLAIQQ
jgi:threonine dehydrogenase-like Zn-dependent dehydrogenase